MEAKPSYEELEQRVKELEKETIKRRQTDEALKESEKRYRMLFEKAGDAIFILQAEGAEAGKVVDTNQSAAEMHGYTVDELLAMNIKDLDTPAVAKQAPGRIRSMLAGEWIKAELTHRRKDGSVFPVEISAGLLELGDHKYILAFDRDISERKLAQETLKESELKHKTLVQNIPGMVYRGYADWSAEIFSGSEEICGYTKKELNSKKEGWLRIIHYDDKARVTMEGSELAKRKQSIVQTYRIVTKGGDNCWVEDRKTSLFTEEGEFIGIDGIVVDITKRKLTEEALQKIHVELEQRVEKRTRELEVQKNRLQFLSSRLIKAQEQERRRVSKGLHDEMGQALAILKLRLRSIQREFPEGQSSLKEEFDDTTQYIDQIIENVRRLSRDLSPAILEDLGLSAALKWLIKNFGKQHSIRTSVEIVNIDHLFSQETQTNLYRIFQEALTNILKHARAGHVSFVVKKEEKGSVFFLIKDNGKGFDVNEAESGNIAERGMGLTAMNERAYMMGAILDIQSRPGEGTRITLEIST